MRIYTVTMIKGQSKMVLKILYKDTVWPAEVETDGDTENFRFPSGKLPTCKASMDRLERVARHQADQVGAEDVLIEHDHGDVIQFTDEVIFPES